MAHGSATIALIGGYLVLQPHSYPTWTVAEDLLLEPNTFCSLIGDELAAEYLQKKVTTLQDKNLQHDILPLVGFISLARVFSWLAKYVLYVTKKKTLD